MEKKETIEFVEKKMLQDIKTYVDDNNKMNNPIDSIGLMMCMASSQESLKIFLNKSGSIDSIKEIDDVLGLAYRRVYNKVFETEINNKVSVKPKFNTVFVGTIIVYKPTELDMFDLEDGNMFGINVVAGKAPSKRMMFENEAIAQGFNLGKSYLISSVELDEQPYGERKFELTPLKELKAMEVISAVDKLGPTVIINVD